MRIIMFFLFMLTNFSILYAQPINSDKLFESEVNSLVKISPNGEYVISYSKEKDKDSIILYSKKLKKVTSYLNVRSNEKVRNFRWLNKYQIHLDVKLNGVNKELIIDIEKDKFKLRGVKSTGYLVHIYPEKPNKVIYAKGKRQLYIVSIDDLVSNNFKEAKKIATSENKNIYYFYDDDSKNIIKTEFDKKLKKAFIKYKSLNDKAWKLLLTLDDFDYEFSPVGFINKDKLAVITNKNTDKKVLREFDIKNKKLGNIIYQHPKYDLISASYSSGKLVFVKFRQHGLNKTVFFDNVSSGMMKDLAVTFKDQDVYLVDRTENNKTLLLYTNGPQQPGEYFIYNKNNNVIERFLSAYPDLVDEKFSPSKHLTFTSKDGMTIEAFLTLPSKANNLSTLLVMPHGGPIGIQETDQFNNEVQYYTSRGFSVLRVNFRGSSGFGKAFMDKGVGEFGKLIEEDISLVVSGVTKKHKFKNVCSIGASYGGYSAVMLAIKNPELYKCVVASFGVYDLPLLFNASNFKTTEEYRRIIARTVGEFDQDMINYSPVYLYKKLKAPILLIAGRKDDVADFEHSNRLFYLLNKNNHPVEKVFYKNSGHGHDYWKYDRHQASLSYDFMMRVLNLKYPKPQSLNKSARAALASDFVKIADGYEFNYELTNDNHKAFNYYQMASKYGEGRASYNLGAYYHSGSFKDKNTKKSIEYYELSVNQGYSDGNARIAKLIMDRSILPQDWQKAKEHLEKAIKLKDLTTDKIFLGRFFCTAPEPYKNVDRCIELLDIKSYKKNSDSNREKLSRALSWIFSEGKFNAAEKLKLQNLAKKIFNLNIIKFNADIEDEGQFVFKESDKFDKSGDYELINKSLNVKANSLSKSYFGSTFAVDVPGIDKPKYRLGLVSRWVEKKANQQNIVHKSNFLYGNIKQDWNALISTRLIKKTGTWTLELYDLNQKLVYSKDFSVQAAKKNLKKDKAL